MQDVLIKLIPKRFSLLNSLITCYVNFSIIFVTSMFCHKRSVRSSNSFTYEYLSSILNITL